MFGSFFDDWKNKLPKSQICRALLMVGALGIVGVIVTIILVLISQKVESEQLVIDDPQDVSSSPGVTVESIQSSECCLVEISGAVQKPGVYVLSEGSRIKDVIKKAGGFGPTVDAEFVSTQLNLVEEVKDGQKIVLPFQSSTPPVGESSKAVEDGKVSVNDASEKELIELPFIGQKKAESIVSGRPYSSMEQFFTLNTFSSSQKTELSNILSL